jgi:hypothetical protein
MLSRKDGQPIETKKNNSAQAAIRNGILTPGAIFWGNTSQAATAAASHKKAMATRRLVGITMG